MRILSKETHSARCARSMRNKFYIKVLCASCTLSNQRGTDCFLKKCLNNIAKSFLTMYVVYCFLYIKIINIIIIMIVIVY